MESIVCCSTHATDPGYGDQFDDLTAAAQRTLTKSCGPLFRVDAGNLYATYLAAFPEGNERQFHTCNACGHFILAYGSLATIDERGEIHSALWNEDELPAEHAYWHVAMRLRKAVEAGKVESVFLWPALRWGVPECGGFTHLWANPKATHTRRDINANQAIAAKVEDRKHLAAALLDMKIEHLRTAKAMLSAGSLYRPEHLLPMADFLVAVHEKVGKKRGEARNRALWTMAATAPDGWCTPRGSALGALVKDIADGLDTPTITRRHNEKMNPLQYQRPQTPASEGNIAQAEKLFETMGLAASLRRRFALASEIDTIWREPSKNDKPSGGVFDHLRHRRQIAKPKLTMRPVKMTFAKFRRDVLSDAIELAVMVPYRGNFCALTTACDPDALPILQWDSEAKRNPVAWYVHSFGGRASTWGLDGNKFVRSSCVTLQPSMWSGEDNFGHHGKSAIFILDGCEDTMNGGLALFPECLRSELHAVRRTIEAHSASARLEKIDGPKASGLRTGKESVVVRVTTAVGVSEYEIDRWD